MRSWIPVLVALGLAAPVFAENDGVDQAPAVETESTETEMASSEAGSTSEGAAPDSEGSASEGAAPDSESSTSEAIKPEAEVFHQTTLGAVGRDDRGRVGRVHEVIKGDTLWDISDAYLGTPWVWPSIWHDNTAISNPHLIHPGDRLWITPEEMRPVSEEEAAALMANGSGATLPAAMAGEDGTPVAPEVYHYAKRQTVGFVSEALLQGSATVIDSHIERMLLGENDEVIIGLGAGQVAVGDELEIFRTSERVFFPGTYRPLGWSTRQLGWLQVTEVHAESASGIIRLSRGEVERGDRVLPRRSVDTDIPVAPAPEIEGVVVHTPDDRLNMAGEDVVYLDRGLGDGLAVGSPLEVYRPLGKGDDAVQGRRELPDHVIAKMIVVESEGGTATAVVTDSTDEVQRGDLFRGSANIDL